MTLQARLLLLVSALALFAVAATAIPLTLNSRSSTLDQTRQEAERLAGVVARSAAYSDRAWRDVEGAIGKQMVVQAAITAEWIAAAERAGMPPAAINDRLRAVTRRTTLDEFWVTDPTGHAYLHSVPGIDFTFSPDPREQRQASAFWPLLRGDREVIVQRAQRREVDDRIFKYVGVSGVDEPRIVQVGYEASYLAALRRQVGLVRLVDQTAGSPGVESVRVVDRELGTRVVRESDGGDDAPIDEREAEALRRTEEDGEPRNFEQGDVLTVDRGCPRRTLDCARRDAAARRSSACDRGRCGRAGDRPDRGADRRAPRCRPSRGADRGRDGGRGRELCPGVTRSRCYAP
jgi:hypothetical protein